MKVPFKQIYIDSRYNVPGAQDIVIELDDVSYVEPDRVLMFGGPVVKVHFRSGAPAVIVKGEPKDFLD